MVLSADLRWTDLELELCDISERNDLAGHSAKRQRLQRVEVSGELVVRLHDDAESPLALQHLARRVADAHRLRDLIDVLDAQAISRELAPVGDDPEIPQSGDLLDAHVDGAVDAAHDLGDAIAEAGELVEVGAVEKNGNVGADAGD